MTYNAKHRERLRRAGPAISAWVALIAVTGCGDGFGPNAKEGELGTGYFIYRCVGDSDPYCDEGGTADSFPEAIAVGGHFELDYNTDVDGALPIVESGSDSVQTSGLGFVVARAGYAVMLASEGFGDIVDLLHLRGRDVQRIALATGDSQDLAVVELQAGERLVLAARPQDSDRTTLGGSLDYTWVSDNEDVFVISSADLDESVELRGVGPGEAMLAVTAGGFTQMIAVQTADDGGTTGGSGTGDDTTQGDESSDGGSSDGGSSDGSSSDGGSSSEGSSSGGATTGGTAG